MRGMGVLPELRQITGNKKEKREKEKIYASSIEKIFYIDFQLLIQQIYQEFLKIFRKEL